MTSYLFLDCLKIITSFLGERKLSVEILLLLVYGEHFYRHFRIYRTEAIILAIFRVVRKNRDTCSISL